MNVFIETETTDRSLEEMRAAAKRYDQCEMLPEIADLCRIEQKILKQLTALRFQQRGKQYDTDSI